MKINQSRPIDVLVTFELDRVFYNHIKSKGGDSYHAIDVARQIRAGQITINGGNRENAAPFGGYKMSGNGREHGRIGLEEFLEIKAIISPILN